MASCAISCPATISTSSSTLPPPNFSSYHHSSIFLSISSSPKLPPAKPSQFCTISIRSHLLLLTSTNGTQHLKPTHSSTSCNFAAATSDGESAAPRGRNSGDPLGQKALGKAVVRWVARGMNAMAAEMAAAEKTQNYELIRQKLVLGAGLVEQAKPYLEANPLPQGFEDRCQKAVAHYPTVLDHLQRELQNALVGLQQEGVLAKWEQAESWKCLKERIKSGDHRVIARELPKAKETQTEPWLTGERVTKVQDKINEFTEKFLELLHIERVAELNMSDVSVKSTSSDSAVSPRAGGYGFEDDDAEAENSVSISKLKAVKSSAGLGGVHLVSFESEGGHHLPPSISPGDMVQIRPLGPDYAGKFECLQGTVHSLGENCSSVTIALAVQYTKQGVSKLFGTIVQIDKIPDLANATTFERNCAALELLKNRGLKRKSPAIAVVATLFSETIETCQLAKSISKISSSIDLDVAVVDELDGFDESQKKAIHLALDKHRPVVVIQGPPGTGKTRVVVEVIIRAVSRGEKVLATGPTNAAVDNLVERLAMANVDVVRVGNPVRMAPSILCRSLGSMVQGRLSDCEAEFARKRRNIQRDLRRCAGKSEAAASLKQALKQLSKSYKQKEQEEILQTLRSAQVVLSTNTGASDPLLKKLPSFDLVVVDEAGQAIEPACWIPMLKGKRTVLSGDGCQLAPLVISKQASEGGLGISLMERAAKLHGGIFNTMLTVQYRMHDAIASWASREMYGGLLQSAPTVASHLLRDSPGVQENWITALPLLLLDTRLPRGNLMAGCEECLDPAGTGSIYNEGEADIVVTHVKALLAAGVEGQSIAVQSPYLAQVQLIQDRLQELPHGQDVNVASIDSFQGREADAVIISMVRSNNFGLVGFLGDRRRMNVAVTRARKHITIVCDTSTVGCNMFLRQLLQHFRSQGKTFCAQLQPNCSESYNSTPM